MFRSDRREGSLTGYAYWEARVKKYGARAVLNLSHKPQEYDAVTAEQKRILLPLFAAQLRGDERTVLDFGCGPGRFTASLAEAVQGSAVGVDISEELLKLAPQASNVTYRTIPRGVILPGDLSYDVAWVCLSSGGFRRRRLVRRLRLSNLLSSLAGCSSW